jgi:type 1 glutamine amidotransferase
VGGFPHGSRTAANVLLDSLAKAMDFDLVLADNASVMTAANLAQYDVIILNNTTEAGKMFNPDQRAALLGFMEKKGYVGFHGAGDTKTSFPDYTAYLGAELSSHGGGTADINLDTSAYAKVSPITKGLMPKYNFDEEWYAYKTNPRVAPNVKVLYTLDEASCPKCTLMRPPEFTDHPVVWVKEPPGGGRTFYYAMGHYDHIFKKNEFCKTLLVRALEWTSKCAIVNPKAPMAPCGVSVQRSGIKDGSLADLGVQRGAGYVTLQTPDAGNHRVELLTLTGKRIAARTGSGTQTYTFSKLPSGTVYSIVLHGAKGRQSQLVAIP